MSELDSRCEKCERDLEQLRHEVGDVIALVKRVVARADEVLAKVEIRNRQMIADLQTQTEAGFASLRASIDARALPRSDRKDEPPKLN
jgi:hypothetical protein